MSTGLAVQMYHLQWAPLSVWESWRATWYHTDVPHQSIKQGRIQIALKQVTVRHVAVQMGKLTPLMVMP